uniref:Anaphylatoxin-like domain-containing protein n=1 Tax=Urocitellus parryii TaxID=9999 RepID=A0A8D2HA11_UROPR
MDILSMLCIFFCLGRSWGQKQIYIISAPKAFYVGASENVVIQVYGYRESFDVTIAIKSYPDKSFTYSFGQVNLSPENKFQNSANLIIKPEDLSGGPNAVSNVYLEVVSACFSKASKIPLRYDTGFLFIQTDRSVYYSNEQVKVRVYSLDENLKPSQKEVILTFIDPEGSEVAVGEERSATGIITFPDFKIPFHPKYGLWTIKANYKEDFTTIGTADFEIKRHELFVIISASQFRHPVIRKCCYDGAHVSEESCRERALRITVGQQCSKAFLKCCDLASELRANSSHIDVIIARSSKCKSFHSVCSAVGRCWVEFVLPQEEEIPNWALMYKR